MMMLLNTYFLLACLFSCTAAIQILNLNSENNVVSWIVTNGNKTITASSSVPGGIYTDLRKYQILPQDIYHRSNDELYRWVSHDNWTFSLNFSVPENWLPEAKEILIFNGVDTVAWVTLNDVLLSPKLDNMFVRHQLNVSGTLKYNGLENQLKVKLISPLLEVKERSRLWPHVVPDCVPSAYHGECHANLLRKVQASFSWDWGPAFPSLGIWKDVGLITYNGAILRDVTVSVNKLENNSMPDGGKYWNATFILHLEAFTPGGIIDGLGQVVLNFQDVNKNEKDDFYDESYITAELEVKSGVADENGDFQLAIHLIVSEEKISLWWPNGFGSQPLYTATATFESKGSGFTEKTLKKVKIGFRNVELVQDPIGKSGLSFYFRVNGVPVFAKGSNWIPPYALPEWSATKSGEEMIRHLLLSAKEVGINMLRVWGGGNYESDYFYNVADELGILIWQDMMFACSMYPVVPDFLNSVTKEVKQQVRRLQHHPSIAIWAGNNENEAALRQNWYGTALNYTFYLHDYALLYGDIIKKSVMSIDPSSIYITSSPSNGKESMAADGFVAKDPQSNLYGDIHYYNYLSNTWNPYVYPLPRFASEYGFQSLPSMETLRGAGASDEDWGTNTDFFQRRQHHPGGYEEMKMGISRHIVLPTNIESEEGMAQFIYLSQIYQAMGLKVETEVYRRGRGRREPLGNGEIEGGTMGALYWQLNDIWQAPSWASIEYGGKWKMAHYFSKGFLSTFLASPIVTVDNQLIVYLLSDVLFASHQKSLNCTLIVRTYSWDNPCPVGVKSMDLIMNPLSAEVGFTSDLQTFLESSGCKGGDIDSLKKSCFLTFDLNFPNDSYEAPRNFILLSSPKDAINMEKANVTITSIGDTFPTEDPDLKGHYPYSTNITLSSDGVALFVWLENLGMKGRFSDNGFLLVASEEDPICRKATTGEVKSDGITDSREHLQEEGHTTLKGKNIKLSDNDCPFDCSKMDNSIIMAICCAEKEEMDDSLTKKFSHTFTFYFQEEHVNSSALHETLSITHLLSILQ